MIVLGFWNCPENQISRIYDFLEYQWSERQRLQYQYSVIQTKLRIPNLNFDVKLCNI